MTVKRKVFLVILTIVLSLAFFGFSKKRKFLDHFVTYKQDTLSIYPMSYETIYEKPDASLLGNFIDTTHLKAFKSEAAEDLRYFSSDDKDRGPAAYHKIKLGLGFYFLIIRSGGEYFNSRYYGCLYNAGNDEITSTILLADELGDAGYYYLTTSTLKKENKLWTIYTHAYYSEPVDYEKYEMDSIQITDIHLNISIQAKDEHYFFVEESRDERSFHQ